MAERPGEHDVPGEARLVDGREAVRTLRLKYAEMRRLRLADLREAKHAHDGAPCAPCDPRPAMAALARAHPGALREIDELPLHEIESRLTALDAMSAGAEPARWAVAMATFHALTRGALAVKRWLGGRKTIDASTRIAFENDLHRGALPAEAARWRTELARIAAPPGGRLAPIVHEELARLLGTTPSEVRALIFTHARRRA